MRTTKPGLPKNVRVFDSNLVEIHSINVAALPRNMAVYQSSKEDEI